MVKKTKTLSWLSRLVIYREYSVLHFPPHLDFQVPLARSEGNLLDLMENVCERMKDYGERVDPSTSRKTYERIVSRDGEAMDLSEAKLDSRVTSSLKFAVSARYLNFQKS